MKTFTLIASLLATSVLASAVPAHSPPMCGTCNPLSGQNSCDITTSCINTGKYFHCACRAGYKASRQNNNAQKQFRLQMPNYEFLVFTPENTKCDTLCDDLTAAPGDLCKEVPIQKYCPV